MLNSQIFPILVSSGELKCLPFYRTNSPLLALRTFGQFLRSGGTEESPAVSLSRFLGSVFVNDLFGFFDILNVEFNQFLLSIEMLIHNSMDFFGDLDFEFVNEILDEVGVEL
jgi:hypothetical protein